MYFLRIRNLDICPINLHGFKFQIRYVLFLFIYYLHDLYTSIRYTITEDLDRRNRSSVKRKLILYNEIRLFEKHDITKNIGNETSINTIGSA